MVRKLLLSLIAVLGIAMLAEAQNRQVSGTVTSADGNPIAGATILVEGTHAGTTTGADGSYAISAPANGALAVSFIGYASQKIAIAGKTTINVKLVEDAQAIENVIVVAFGTAKKEAFTGSAAVMKSDDIAKVQTGNVAQALAGKVSGVQITNESGQPGSAPKIRIRGISSINADSKPLIILDGMPYQGDMSNINPSDIESMTVLKDAASNALYGARGANGVIMLTTKKGRSGDAVITVDAKWGVNSRALREYDYIKSPGQYYETHFKSLYNMEYSQSGDPTAAYNWANKNLISGSYGLGYQVYNVPDGQNIIGTNGKLNPNATLGRKVVYDGEEYYLRPDNWNDEAFRTALRQEYNVSIAGGTDRATFFASFGYLSDEGIVINSDYKRLTGRLKADYQAKKWLKVGGTAAYANFSSNSLNDEGLSGSSGNLFTFTSNVGPIYPVYIRDGQGRILRDARGFKRYDYGDGKNAGLARPVMSSGNPLSSTQLDKNNRIGNAVNGNLFADITFLNDFKLTLNGGVSLDETRFNNLTNPFYGQYASSNGIVSVYQYGEFSYNFQQLLNYHKVLGDHTLDAMIGHEYFDYRFTYLFGSRSNMLTPGNTELNGSVVNGTPASYNTTYNTEGYFGRFQYDYKEKIFASASYRRDASSRFHPKHRWGNFWSVGVAWLMNKEEWFNAKWVDLLKLKASYGSQGNDNIGDYRYTDMFYIKSAGGEVSVPPFYPGKEDITWETNSNLNAGIEFGLFNNRLNGSVDYFYRKTSDMLFERPVPLSMGYSSYYDNIGDMVNKGVEVELTGLVMSKKNFSWEINLNATFLKNKVTKLPPEKKNGYAMPKESYWIGVGDAFYTWYISKYAGVSEDGQSMWYVDVLDENEKVVGREKTTDYSASTKYKCGNPFPSVYGGFGTTLNFYGFDLGVNFTYQIGGEAYDYGYAGLMNSPKSGSTGSNVHRDILKAWTPENTSSNIPRYQMGDQYSAQQSDRFLTDASFLNIQNINFGYTLPRKWTSKLSIERIRVYLACDNVWYWSKREGFDPRQTPKGETSAERYSPVRTISGGVTIQF